MHKSLQIKQYHVANNYLKHFTSQEISDKDTEFTKWDRWDESTIKTTHRLDRFAGQLMVQSSTARRNPEMASLLP